MATHWMMETVEHYFFAVGGPNTKLHLVCQFLARHCSLQCPISIDGILSVKELNADRYSSPEQVISQLRGDTCHSVTFHPTQLNTPHLIPSRLAGTRFAYPRGTEG